MPVTFSEQSTSTFPQPAAGGRMTFIDADGDGDLDILYQTGANGTAFQYARSNGDGTYTILALSSSPFAGLSIPDHNGANFHVGDIDGDGDMDLWAGQTTGAGTGSYFRNDNGTFTSQSSATFPQPGASSRVVMGDFDGDGDADMLYQTVGNGTAFQYARSNGDGTYTLLAIGASPFNGLTIPDNSGGTHYAADFDGDGDIDVWAAVASTTGSYFVNNGNGTFSAGDSSTFPAPAAATRVSVGDFDSDGDTDIVYQTAGDGSVWQYARSNGDGTMTILSQAASPFAGVTLLNHNGSNALSGDVDGDGDDDLIITTNGTQGEFYLADGKPPEITSSTPSDNATGVGSTANITITFDESVSKGSGNIYIYRGDGVLIETISVGSAQVTGSGTTWTIDPSVTLAGLTNYYILTDDGIFRDADGSIFAGISSATTLNFTTAAVNTAPTFGNLNGDLAGYTEGAGAVRLDVAGNATVADAEQANFNGGTLTVTITANGVAAQDVLSVANIGTGAGQISVSGANISYQGVQIGTFTGGTAGAALTITLDPDATPAATQALVRALQYNNTSDAPNTATRTITTVLTDGAGGTSATQTTSVSITAVNDTPVNAVPGTQTINEDASLTLSTANGNAISVADADATTLTVTLSVANGELTLASTTGLSFSVGDGTADTTFTFTGTAAAINAALGAGLSYVPGANFNGSDAISVVTNDGGQTGNDPGLTGAGTTEEDTDTVAINVVPVNDVHTGGASISGTATEDQVLTAVSTLADPDGLGTLHYQWQRDTGSGYVNVGADQATYTLGDADVGGVVRVVIYYTDAGGTVESATSGGTAAIAGVNDPHTGGASITGTATEDQVLTAVSTLADTDGLGTLHYDWQRDTGSGFVSIGAADQATYTLGDADVGGVVRVVISYTDGQGFSESATSAGTAAIANVNDVHTGGVSITGTATEDQVLTAVSTLADADGLGTLHYQWQRDTGGGFVNVGADQATYTLGDADVGGVIRVVAYYTDGRGTVESATSAATTAVANFDDAAVAVDDSDTVLESAVLNGSVVANDTDIDGPAFVVTEVNGVAGDVGSQITLPSGALLTLNADGTYSYDPNDVFNALSGPASGGTNLTATDSFTYTLANGNTATVTITIVGEDSPGDSVEGDSGDNTLTAGDGEDTLVGGAGNDALDGGDGEDTADYSGSPGGVHIRLNGGFGDDGHGGTDTLTNIENLIGSANNDILIGAAGGNLLSGGAGADVLIGLDGDDLLIGGAGAANQLQGGQGDDTYIIEANDTVVELENQGNDRIFTSRNAMTLVANVEELHFTGAGAFTGTGNALNNTIVGGAGDDLLNGGLGSDILIGGAGNDTVTFAAFNGVLVNLASGMAAAFGDIDTLSGIENVIGSSSSDTLTGDGVANILSGGAGDDFLAGGAGNDVLQGGAGVDTANYEASASAVVVRLDLSSAQDGYGGVDSLSSIENVWGSQFNDLIIGNAAANLLSGGDGADILMGRDGDDFLIGGSGAANTLYGGAGNDTYMVRANDTIHELVGEGVDTVVTDRSYYVLAANVENLEYDGSGDFAGVGNALDNEIYGGDGRDTLTGGAGNDDLDGGDGHDTAVFTGAQSQYTILNLGGGRYRVTDNTAARDGVDVVANIEQLRFSDGVLVLNSGPASPVLSAKEAPVEVSPLMDDAFLLPKDMELPQVLPTDDAFGAPLLGGAVFQPTGADMLTIDDGGLLLPAADDHRGAHHHDDWML